MVKVARWYGGDNRSRSEDAELDGTDRSRLERMAVNSYVYW